MQRCQCKTCHRCTYVASSLIVKTPLTGRYKRKQGAVDLRAVMREIEDTREEENERLRRMSGD